MGNFCGKKGRKNQPSKFAVFGYFIMWWVQNWNDRKFNYYPSNHPVQTLHYTHVVGPSALFGSNSFLSEDALADAYAMIYQGSYILEESYKLSKTKNYWKGPFSINHTKS